MGPPKKQSSKTKERKSEKKGPQIKKVKGWKQTKMTAFSFGKQQLKKKKVEKGDTDKKLKNLNNANGDEESAVVVVKFNEEIAERSKVVVEEVEEKDRMVTENALKKGNSSSIEVEEGHNDDTMMDTETVAHPQEEADVSTVTKESGEESGINLGDEEAEIFESCADDDDRELVGEKPGLEEKEKQISPSSTAEPEKTSKSKPKEDKVSQEPKVKPVLWEPGTPTPYLHLARTYEVLERTPGRLDSLSLLHSMFKKIVETTPEDLLPAVYLTVGKLAPAWKNVSLSIGGSTIAKAVTTTCSVSRETLRAKFKLSGDLGDAALAVSLKVRRLSRPKPLTARGIYNSIKKLAGISGKGGVKEKAGIVTKMVASCREVEIKFLIRTLISNLRIGAVDKTVLAALAKVFGIDSEELGGRFAVCPSYDVLIPALLKLREEQEDEVDGSKMSERLGEICAVRFGVPLRPMLGKIIRSVEDMIARFGEDVQVLSEYKYDGQRAQIHICSSKFDGGVQAKDSKYSVQLFSRHLQDMTVRYPDICRIVSEVAERNKLQSGIFDAEIVAVSSKNVVLPFQALAARPRSAVNSDDASGNTKASSTGAATAPAAPTVQVCVVCFDAMMLNDVSLLSVPLEIRRQEMRAAMKEDSTLTSGWKFAESITTRDPLQVTQFLDKAVSDRCEGLLCKALTGPFSFYEPATRRESWSKVKKDYITGGGLDVDVVPIGGWQGQGRKHKWYSPVLLAVWHDGELQSLCKCMSGFTDEMYTNIAKYYRDGMILESKPSYYNVDEAMTPSTWFEASQVWEIKGADLSISPIHTAAAGLVDETKGLSLRFPRFIKIRDDKDLEDSNSAQDIADMFYGQANRAPSQQAASNIAIDDGEESDQ